MVLDCSDACGRLDKFIQENEPTISRRLIQESIKCGKVIVDDSVVKKPAFDIVKSQKIQYELSHEEKSTSLVPAPLDLDIVYQDEHVLVLNKQRGVLVHPVEGSDEITLVNGIRYANIEILGGDSYLRPGVVQRLDRFTEGLLVLSKSDSAYEYLKDQFKQRKVIKKYYAMVKGALAEEEYSLTTMMGRHRVFRQKQTSLSPVPGTEREAISNIKVIKRYNTKTFCDVQIFTGRTHQIRVHCAEMGHPVIGDALYDVSSGKKYDGQYLQCYHLSFKHPETETVLSFTLDASSLFS